MIYAGPYAATAMILARFDKDNSGAIEFNEFAKLLTNTNPSRLPGSAAGGGAGGGVAVAAGAGGAGGFGAAGAGAAGSGVAAARASAKKSETGKGALMKEITTVFQHLDLDGDGCLTTQVGTC
jgi:hypothetical protein